MGREEHGGNAQKLRWANGLSEDGADASRLGRAVQVEAHCCGLTQDVPFGQQFSSLSSPSAKPTDPQEATAESMVRVWVALVACSFVGAFRAARPFVGSACWPNIFFKYPQERGPKAASRPATHRPVGRPG